MNFISLIFLSGVFASDIIDLSPSDEDADLMSGSNEIQDKEEIQAEEESAVEDQGPATESPPAVEQIPEDQASLTGDQSTLPDESPAAENTDNMEQTPAKKPQENQNQAQNQEQDETHYQAQNPEAEARDKNNQGFRDSKQYSFTTQNANGTESEISVKATTHVQFTLKNYKVNKTQPSGKSTEENIQQRLEKNIPKPTSGPNETEFWTMIANAISATNGNPGDKEQLFQPIPDTDVTSGYQVNPEDIEDIKLKLMLGVSLLTLLLFVLFLAICSALLYKMKAANSKKEYSSEYTVNPELAEISYFHPSEGISDTSFSKSGESSTYWGNTSSETKKSETIEIKTLTQDISLADSDDTGLIEESDLPQSEEVSEEIRTNK